MSIVEIIPLVALVVLALIMIVRGPPSKSASGDKDDVTKVWWGR